MRKHEVAGLSFFMPLVAITTAEVAKEKKLMKLQYDPTQDELDTLANVRRDYDYANNLRNLNWREFNDLDVLQRQGEDQKTFNAYIPPKDESSDEYWKAQTVRPVTRNKVIAIAARITSTLIAPHVFAQNRKDEEERDAARVMEELMEWANDQSGYVKTFLNAVIAMLVNPAACVQVGFQEVKRTMKEANASGGWTEKTVVDEEESGFADQNVPIDEVYLGNMYIQDIQKQPFVIRDRNIDYVTAKLKYQDFDNWKYVKPGMRAVFSEDDTSFYEEQDFHLQGRLVNEVIYYNRNEDLELVYLNGILMTKTDQPLKRKDKKYPFVWGGYELVDEGQFAYFKSLVFKLMPEQEVVDEMYNMVLDGSFLSLMPPYAIFGEEMVDSNIVQPGVGVAFSDPNTKMEVFHPRGDLTSGYNAIQSIEANMAEGSQAAQASGVPATGNRTAFEVATIEENARIQLGLFGKMIAQFVRDWGELRVGDILQHMTVFDSQKISTEGALSYKTLLIEKENNQDTVKIEFRSDLPDEPMTEEEALQRSLELLERGVQKKQKIWQVNPKLFRELKYKIRVNADVLFQPTGAIERALNLELYDRSIGNPLITGDVESFTNVTRDMLLEQFKPGESDKYLPKKKVTETLQNLGRQQQGTDVRSELVEPLQTGVQNTPQPAEVLGGAT